MTHTMLLPNDYPSQIELILNMKDSLEQDQADFEQAYSVADLEDIEKVFELIDVDIRAKVLRDYYEGQQVGKVKVSWPSFCKDLSWLFAAFQRVQNEGTFLEYRWRLTLLHCYALCRALSIICAGRLLAKLNMEKQSQLDLLIKDLRGKLDETDRSSPRVLDNAVSAEMQKQLLGLHAGLKDILTPVSELRNSEDSSFEDIISRMPQFQPHLCQTELEVLYPRLKQDWERHVQLREKLEDQYSALWVSRKKEFGSFECFRSYYVDTLPEIIFKACDLETIRVPCK